MKRTHIYAFYLSFYIQCVGKVRDKLRIIYLFYTLSATLLIVDDSQPTAALSKCNL